LHSALREVHCNKRGTACILGVCGARVYVLSGSLWAFLPRGQPWLRGVALGLCFSHVAVCACVLVFFFFCGREKCAIFGFQQKKKKNENNTLISQPRPLVGPPPALCPAMSGQDVSAAADQHHQAESSGGTTVKSIAQSDPISFFVLPGFPASFFSLSLSLPFSPFLSCAGGNISRARRRRPPSCRPAPRRWTCWRSFCRP